MRWIIPCLLILSLPVACSVGAVQREETASAPSDTPTLIPSPVATEIVPPTPTYTSTPPPTHTYTPLPSPTSTHTPTPTPTHTPTPTTVRVPTRTPTSTPSPTPTPCFIGLEFHRLATHPSAMSRLGCPTTMRYQTWAAEERFQRGRMFWREYPDVVHVLYDTDGTYRMWADLYMEGDPEDACPDVGSAPSGLFKPVRGFNWHWCKTLGVRHGLGWALEQEVGYEASWQGFEHGHVLQSRADHIFIFYDDGTWDYIE